MNDQVFSNSEIERYARHFIIPEIGKKGQIALKNASVLIIGAGGLGSASSMYLAAAGIGKIGIVDSDNVELSNLQRQVIHGTSTIGSSKVNSASQRLLDINPYIEIIPYLTRVTSETIQELLDGYSIVLDATDNFETRYLANYECVKQQKPFIFASVYHFYGQLSVFDASKGPCFRCVFKEYPSEEIIESNRGVGVCSPLPGIMGTMQALETIKLIVGIGSTCMGRLLLFDGLEMRLQKINIKKDISCPDCSSKDIHL